MSEQIEKEIRQYLILYRMGEYNEEITAKNVLSISGIRIEDPDQSLPFNCWDIYPLIQNPLSPYQKLDIKEIYLEAQEDMKQENWIKMLPKEESNE